MSPTPAFSPLRSDLRAIYVDGLAYSAMVGIGETYIPAFALAVGLSAVDAGLIATVPMLAGSVLQLAAPRWVAAVGSQRRWVVGCVVIQAASFLPLVVAAIAGSIPGALLYLVATLYWASGLACGPAWTVWVETLVPRRIRIRYFARRSRALHVFVVAGLVAGGWILQAGSHLERPQYAFALLFAFACLARMLSAAALARQSEPVPMPRDLRRVGWRDFLRRLRAGRDGRLLAYVLAVQTTVQIAAPYFTPYMLTSLRFSYAQHMSLLAVAVVGKFAALPLHAWIAQRFGVRTLLWVGGLALVPTPAYWLLSSSYPWLLAVQLVAGASFAAYELATFLLYFDAIRPGERTSVLTIFNLANSAAIVLGSLAGAHLLRSFGGGADAYAALFAISFALRWITLLPLSRIDASHAAALDLPTGTEAVRASVGSLEEPVLPGIPARSASRSEGDRSRKDLKASGSAGRNSTGTDPAGRP